MVKNDIFLGVNIDHIATLRQARGTDYPDLITAAEIAENSGADSITIHLREDRRHIQSRDVWELKKTLKSKMNLEMAVTDKMLRIACEVKPEDCCLVPEKREELTTEGGLDIASQKAKITDAIAELHAHNIRVSPFVDADNNQIEAAFETGAKIIEIHTGHYADARGEKAMTQELYKIIQAAKFASKIGLQVNTGHGLHYTNVQRIAVIPEVVELNIGHAIVSRAIFSGFEHAVSQMKELIIKSRKDK